MYFYFYPSDDLGLFNYYLLIANYYGKNALKEYSENGKHIRDIPCFSKPFELTVIDTGRIVVTYGSADYIVFFNIKSTVNKRKTIKFMSGCYGISYQDNKRFIFINEGIAITDVPGKVINILTVSCGSYIGTATDRIYFTFGEDETVHCISVTGE